MCRIRSAFVFVDIAKASYPPPERDHISAEARDFITKLLVIDPAHRLGACVCVYVYYCWGEGGMLCVLVRNTSSSC